MTGRVMMQDDYSAIVNSLDVAMKVFVEMTGSEEKAAEALKDFLSNHYLSAWRAMSPARRAADGHDAQQRE